jgi:hypothetical protein
MKGYQGPSFYSIIGKGHICNCFCQLPISAGFRRPCAMRLSFTHRVKFIIALTPCTAPRPVQSADTHTQSQILIISSSCEVDYSYSLPLRRGPFSLNRLHICSLSRMTKSFLFSIVYVLDLQLMTFFLMINIL